WDGIRERSLNECFRVPLLSGLNVGTQSFAHYRECVVRLPDLIDSHEVRVRPRYDFNSAQVCFLKSRAFRNEFNRLHVQKFLANLFGTIVWQLGPTAEVQLQGRTGDPLVGWRR